MNILTGIGRLFGFVDKVTATPEERRRMREIEASQEGSVAKARGKTIVSEAQGSWLQRNWRPISMLVFLVLVVLDVFEVLPSRLPQAAWDLMSLGFIGYVSGRSVEKIFRR
jgi:hypothetical protein